MFREVRLRKLMIDWLTLSRNMMLKNWKGMEFCLLTEWHDAHHLLGAVLIGNRWWILKISWLDMQVQRVMTHIQASQGSDSILAYRVQYKDRPLQVKLQDQQNMFESLEAHRPMKQLWSHPPFALKAISLFGLLYMPLPTLNLFGNKNLISPLFGWERQISRI